MIRWVTTFALAAAVAVSIGLYDLKYRVEQLESRKADLARSLAVEHESIRVLNAEWSYLNQPDRLQDLTERFLALGRPEPWQVADVRELPPRLEAAADGPLQSLRMIMPPAKPARAHVRYRSIALTGGPDGTIGR